MGDMADMAFEEGLQEMIDGDRDDEYWEHDTWFPTVDRICKYCQKGNMHWGFGPGGWRLFDKNNVLHSCLKKEPPMKQSKYKASKPKPETRSTPMGLFTRQPVYVSDRGQEFQLEDMQPTHLLNAIDHHRKQIATLDWILEQTGNDNEKNQMLHLRRISLCTTVEALVKELRTRDPDEDNEHLL